VLDCYSQRPQVTTGLPLADPGTAGILPCCSAADSNKQISAYKILAEKLHQKMIFGRYTVRCKLHINELRQSKMLTPIYAILNSLLKSGGSWESIALRITGFLKC
jgi:hypothetical protein